MKVSYPEYSFDNTFFDNIIMKSKNQKKTGPYVSITCINDANKANVKKQEEVSIYIKNIPFDCRAINVVKRNITKKEKKFNIIQNFDQEDTNLQKEKSLNILELKTQKTIFLKKQNNDNEFVFIDNDIEEGDAYEYKAMVYKDNGETELSVNSYEIIYEKRRNIIDVKIRSKKAIDSQNNQMQDKFSLPISFSVSVKKDSIDKLFDSLDRNSYDLFAAEFAALPNPNLN